MNCNRVLKQITYALYQRRPVMPAEYRTNYRIERANGGLLCDLWFLTVGCVHDACGGCVMCNYGKGSGRIDQARILEELQKIVKNLPDAFEDFLLTPSGSMLDEREVSKEMRERMASILKGVRAKRFIVESRTDTITESGLDFLSQTMPGAQKYIEIGLESSDDWVLKHCINKGSSFADFSAAVQKAHARQILVTANVGLGFPFMSERAAIRNTVQTIQDALDAGADSIVVFPYHVKHGTLLEVLEQNELYDCVSLWALASVLGCFPEDQEKIQISWYKDYFGEQRSYIYRSPGTCPRCAAEVMELLDCYRETQDRRYIDRLNRHPCVCRSAWEDRLKTQPETVQLERAERDYRALAQLFSIDQELLEKEISIMKREYWELKKR